METYSLLNGRTLKVVQDSSPESPRTWDNLSKMIFFGSYSHLGDKHNVNSNNFNSFDELAHAIAEDMDVAVVKPIYMYSHSGQTISTKPFGCRWDSGQLGFAIVTKEAIRKEYSTKRVTQKYRDLAEKVLEGEVEVLDQYICGDVYGYIVEDENGVEEDSCWGFYGSDVEENGILDYLNEEDRQHVLTQV